MIIIKLKQGMGNQLFQYAIGRSLALRHNVCLKMDISDYSWHRGRSFALGYFTIPHIDTDVSMHMEEPFFLYEEPHFHYDDNVMEVTPNTYVDGFWQSEKYFKPIKQHLLDELKIKQPFIARIQTKAHAIREKESVAVHIRRGDYLTARFINILGVLPVEYYEYAIKILAGKISHPTFYFFSDDIDWVRQHIHVDYPHEFISCGISQSSIEDFYLMTQCRHQIIANSTFSWWAAWLNEYQHKIVIAPVKWFSKARCNTKDLIPEDWITI